MKKSLRSETYTGRKEGELRSRSLNYTTNNVDTL